MNEHFVVVGTSRFPVTHEKMKEVLRQMQQGALIAVSLTDSTGKEWMVFSHPSKVHIECCVNEEI